MQLRFPTVTLGNEGAGEPVNYHDPEGLLQAIPGFCDAIQESWGSGFWDPTSGEYINAGGGGGLPTGSQGAILDGLGQYFQGLGYSVLPGAIALPAGGIGITICAGSGLCEITVRIPAQSDQHSCLKPIAIPA